MSTCPLNMSEMFDSLTGFDEIAIRKAFGANVTDFAKKGSQRNPTFFTRSLIFVHRRREGDKDTEAYAAAMAMPLGVAQEYFADEPEKPEGADLEDGADAEGKALTT